MLKKRFSVMCIWVCLVVPLQLHAHKEFKVKFKDSFPLFLKNTFGLHFSFL